jgi:hypothetical protein
MPKKGYKQTAEHRAKHSMATKGVAHSSEHNAKVADFLRSPELRAKQLAAVKGRKQTPEHRAKVAAHQTGEKSRWWKGGRHITKRGYIQLKRPDHLCANAHGYVMGHRLVMEAHVGRVLLPFEVVHHINGVLLDNRIENLMLFSKQGEHIRYHKSINEAQEAENLIKEEQDADISND